MKKSDSFQKKKVVTPYTLFKILLNLIAIIVAGLSFNFLGFSAEFHAFMRRLDVVLSLLLLADFVWRFSQVEPEDRRAFLLPWGIIDFLGCFPASPIFRIFRLIRVVRLIGYLRQIGLKQIVVNLKQQVAASSLWGVVALTIPTIIVSGWWIFKMEEEFCVAENNLANICSLGDGIWWSFVTVTTVGYGDRFPVSNGGRILAGLLMTIGVGLFGVLTSYLATIFIRQDDEQQDSDLLEELAEVKQELAEIKALLSETSIEGKESGV